ncbi:hypothetical protein [Nakamurella sp. PAMC28650]|uniref:hypothetical protein n=1 Tax=Nakamurella sp. PAMC28650 TaxID=2762325 RepID=UPI00351BABE6
MDRAGIPGTPHALRHWFGPALREAGVDSLVIKELMGHEPPRHHRHLRRRTPQTAIGRGLVVTRHLVGTTGAQHRRRHGVRTVRPVRLGLSVGRVTASFDGPVRADEESPTLADNEVIRAKRRRAQNRYRCVPTLLLTSALSTANVLPLAGDARVKAVRAKWPPSEDPR